MREGKTIKRQLVFSGNTDNIYYLVLLFCYSFSFSHKLETNEIKKRKLKKKENIHSDLF